MNFKNYFMYSFLLAVIFVGIVFLPSMDGNIGYFTLSYNKPKINVVNALSKSADDNVINTIDNNQVEVNTDYNNTNNASTVGIVAAPYSLVRISSKDGVIKSTDIN